ncbi:MAG: alanine--tRNA ligase [Candidatus Colwellbacteria bacterium]|nr:alanine--tRNA ligase [Candidatus Colwellbacteria bacterium]
MVSEQVREKFLRFFEKRGHTVVPSSSLSSDDPSVLITTAGMQQFKPYYTGEKDPLSDIHPNLGRPLGSKNTVSIQKSFRTSDIDEVGDETHLTFFEMLGNFSFGGYFKKEAIELSHEFITKELELEIDYVSVFKGEGKIPLDEESESIWRSLGVTDIRRFDREDNFWGPTGSEGPCGPTTEIYIKGVEVWNMVFNEYYSHPDGKLTKLETPGVDTGMGLERLIAVIIGETDVFKTDLLLPIIKKLEEVVPDLDKQSKRVFADHLRASTFLVADGIRPSNKEAGYILRRLLRRIVAYQVNRDVHSDLFAVVVPEIARKFSDVYPGLKNTKEIILVMEEEKSKFQAALGRGLKELAGRQTLTVTDAFGLYESYGLPFELIKEMAPGNLARNLKREDFDKEFEKHQQKSRAGAETKFGGHGLLLNTGEIKAGNKEELNKILRLHTTTHLLQAALRKVLGNEVEQRGSDVNAQRTRFDFTFPRKMIPEEIKQVENLINDVVKKDLPVYKVELPFEEAKKTGALHFFAAKYPPKVKVYYIGKSLENAFSKEFCNGPHVEHTGEIGQVVIKKEEAVSAGVRRVRVEVI